MKKTPKFEIYESFTKKRTTKKYLVTEIDADYQEVMTYAKRFFKCSEAHIDFTYGYIYKDELYLSDFGLPSSVEVVGVAYYV